VRGWVIRIGLLLTLVLTMVLLNRYWGSEAVNPADYACLGDTVVVYAKTREWGPPRVEPDDVAMQDGTRLQPWSNVRLNRPRQAQFVWKVYRVHDNGSRTWLRDESPEPNGSVTMTVSSDRRLIGRLASFRVVWGDSAHCETGRRYRLVGHHSQRELENANMRAGSDRAFQDFANLVFLLAVLGGCVDMFHKLKYGVWLPGY
jgi:hypothetical protein